MRLISIILLITTLTGLVLAFQGPSNLKRADARMNTAGFISSQTVADYKAAKGCSK